MARFQKGSLRKEERKNGRRWVLRFYISKAGRRVEHTVVVGAVSDFPTEFAARQEIERQQLDKSINQPNFQGPFTLGYLAAHYALHELDSNQSEAVISKSPSTISGYRRNLRNYILPKWGKQVALGVEPLEVEQWLQHLKRTKHLKNPTVDKLRRLMNLIFKSAQRYGLIPRNEDSNPIRHVRCKTTSGYESITVTPAQTFLLWSVLSEPESTLVLLAAVTGLRASECLGLQWQDVDVEGQLIHVRRVWTGGQVGEPKTKSSRAAVPLHPILAAYLKSWRDQSPYSSVTDWCFPSFKLKGKKPRVGNMLISDHLRPAAEKVGIVKPGDKIRFGLHTLRHGLASYLVGQGKDPKVVQTMLRHSDVHTTLQIYAHSCSEDRMAAQADMLTAFFAASGTMQ
jgi:integrase